MLMTTNKYLQMSVETTRKFLGGFDFAPICKEIKEEYIMQTTTMGRKKTNAVNVIQSRHSNHKLTTLHKYYRKWRSIRSPETFIVNGSRKNNYKRMALPITTELNIATKIRTNYHEHKRVTYQTISTMAKHEWNKLDSCTLKKFSASNGWVYNFSKRHSLSSQAISLRSSSRNHKDLSDSPEEVSKFRTSYQSFIAKYGSQYVINFDETSRGSLTGRIQTVAPKNCKRQPRIRDIIKGRGLSIGCLITATGHRLKSILVTKGKSKRSLLKYGDYNKDTRCLLAFSGSGWFTDSQILTALDIIHEYTNGKPSLCIWDDYAAHKTERVIERAETYNIELLTVPKGLTWVLQPLDVKINGPYKQMMNSYWLQRHYNENSKDYHTNICETVLECFDRIKPEMIKDSFSCIHN